MIINSNSIVQLVIQNKNRIMINVNVSVKSIAHVKKIIARILVRNEIISVTYILSIILTIFISANVMSSVSIFSDDKKHRYNMDCYILLCTLFFSDHITIYDHHYLLPFFKI